MSASGSADASASHRRGQICGYRYRSVCLWDGSPFSPSTLETTLKKIKLRDRYIVYIDI